MITMYYKVRKDVKQSDPEIWVYMCNNKTRLENNKCIRQNIISNCLWAIVGNFSLVLFSKFSLVFIVDHFYLYIL